MKHSILVKYILNVGTLFDIAKPPLHCARWPFFVVSNHKGNDMKKLVACAALAMFFGAAGAQTAASAVSAASAVPMAVVLSAGVAGGSKVQDAASLALSVPAALAVGGSELVVDTAASTANGVAYGLRRVSDGATVSVEVLSQTAGKVSLAVGSAVTVVSITGGVVLSAAGQAIAFLPNKAGKALLSNRLVK